MRKVGNVFAKDLDARFELAACHVLMIGCSDGSYITDIAKFKPKRLLCVDAHPLVLERAKTKVTGNVEFAQCGYDAISCATGVFDLVVFADSLYRISAVDIPVALIEAVRAVRSHGHIVIHEPGVSGSFQQAEKELCNRDTSVPKGIATRMALQISDMHQQGGEVMEEVVYDFTTLDEFRSAMQHKVTADGERVLEFMRQRGFRLHSEFRTTIFRVY